MDTIYKTNGNKISCVVFLNKKSGSIGFVGRAKCSPTDSFNEEFGKNLAYKRALLKLKKAEFNEHSKNAKKIEPIVRKYNRHQNGAKYTAQSIERIKSEIKSLLSNE